MPSLSSNTPPPWGNLVTPLVAPSFCNATELAIAIWVPLATTTGLLGAIKSNSLLVGTRFSTNLFSLAETQATYTH